MRLIRTIILLCLLGLGKAESIAQTIVWTDSNARRIQRKDVNGGEVETIVQFQAPEVALQIHYDSVTTKLYYRDGVAFHRSNLNGSERENIPTPTVGNFSLNVKARKLYWIVGFSDDAFHRSELDGSGAESHTYPTCCVLTLEAVGDDLFFGTTGNFGGKGVWRADLDGSNEQLVQFIPQTYDIAHDSVENKLYISTVVGIFRMNTDGTGFEHIVPESASHVVVDSMARKLYWGGGPRIRRSDLDGSNVEDFVTAADVGNPNLDIRGLTFVQSEPVTGACCFGDPFGHCTDDTLQSACTCTGCVWRPFQSCSEIGCSPQPIPTVSAWGLAILSLLLMIAAKIIFARPAALCRIIVSK